MRGNYFAVIYRLKTGSIHFRNMKGVVFRNFIFDLSLVEKFLLVLKDAESRMV